MDYKDLANLIFPDAKEISYYEEKYPERNLPEGAIVTRFAPSPTGFVHIGGLYQGLIARKLAKDYEILKVISWKECKDIMDSINESTSK